MLFEELESKLINLISFPLREKIKIEFNGKKIQLSVVIYQSGKKIPTSVSKYVLAREGMKFKPHETSFYLDGESVKIVQEISFEFRNQQTLRQQVHAFWQMAKSCYQMLMEIAAEEKLASFRST